MIRKVRLLQLTDRLGFAGAENLLYTFATGLDRTLFELHTCGLRPGPPEAVSALREVGFPVFELNQRHAYDVNIIGSLVNYIRREQIDIIHTHLLAADIMGRLAGFITRCPVVSTIHNARVDLDLEPRYRQWMERWTARLWCRRLIVVSPMLRNETARWFGVPLSRVIAISNGIDTARFRVPPDFNPAAIKRELLGGNYPMVTNVARLVPQKGQSYLVEAAVRVLVARPDVRFVVVGDGPLRNEITEQARSLGIADRFIITGLRTDVPQILGASDVFVLSSLWEGMPLSLLEAMAAGCPAVATEAGGVADVLQHNVTGLLVPPANPDALASAITECLDNRQPARQRATTAESMVRQKHDKSVMIRKWEAVYLHVLRRQRSQHTSPVTRA